MDGRIGCSYPEPPKETRKEGRNRTPNPSDPFTVTDQTGLEINGRYQTAADWSCSWRYFQDHGIFRYLDMSVFRSLCTVNFSGLHTCVFLSSIQGINPHCDTVNGNQFASLDLIQDVSRDIPAPADFVHSVIILLAVHLEINSHGHQTEPSRNANHEADP